MTIHDILKRLRRIRWDPQVRASVRDAIKNDPRMVIENLGEQAKEMVRVRAGEYHGEGVPYEHAEAEAFEDVAYEIACEELNGNLPLF